MKKRFAQAESLFGEGTPLVWKAGRSTNLLRQAD
jgi:hypothetical protein